MLIDAHAHLLDSSFLKDRDKVIARAKEAGVGIIVENGLTYVMNKLVLDFTSRYDIVAPAIGLNPVDASRVSGSEFRETLEFFTANVNDVIAFGEIGIDFYWLKDAKIRETMTRRFDKILALAKKLKKPVIVHSRSAIPAVLELLERHKVKGLLHAFGGTLKQAQQAADLGFLIGINPNVVRSQSAQKLVKGLPLKALMTESDAPYLGPIREERNEPANIKLAVEKIAEIKGLSFKNVEREIEKNFKRVFGSTL